MANPLFRRWKPPLPTKNESTRLHTVTSHWRSWRSGAAGENHYVLLGYIEAILLEGPSGDEDGIFSPDDYAFAYRVFQNLTLGKELARNARA